MPFKSLTGNINIMSDGVPSSLTTYPLILRYQGQLVEQTHSVLEQAIPNQTIRRYAGYSFLEEGDYGEGPKVLYLGLDPDAFTDFASVQAALRVLGFKRLDEEQAY